MRATVLTVVAVIVLALVGCRKRSSADDDGVEALSKMQDFASEMCRCTTRECADRVQEDMTKWSTEMAQKASRQRPERPSESLMKAMTDVGMKYAECMTVAMTDGPGSGSGSASVPPPRPPPAMKLSTPSERPSVARLIQEAKEYTRASEDDLVIHVLRARYVASNGDLDPTYGELEIGFGNRLPGAPRIEDDPDRPTGAPIPEPTAAPPPRRPDSAPCPRATWTAKAGWDWGERSCFAQSALSPKCSMADVWKAALGRKDTTIKGKAVAIIALVLSEDKRQIWEFEIRDELRKVDIALRIADSCTPVAEKP